MCWTARAGGRDAKLVVDIWRSMQNPDNNQHSGHDAQCLRCLHDDMPERRRVWKDPNPQAYDTFKKIAGDKRLLKNIAQTSHGAFLSRNACKDATYHLTLHRKYGPLPGCETGRRRTLDREND
ncbi:hypothetical protein V5799_033249 [Amblyomma americanum]|uniref:Uncharacterized protein n=1 Tax=Amblyomma americanum TaxID=6943 RepID=A0AAQ4DNV3_AMBAM